MHAALEMHPVRMVVDVDDRHRLRHCLQRCRKKQRRDVMKIAGPHEGEPCASGPFRRGAAQHLPERIEPRLDADAGDTILLPEGSAYGVDETRPLLADGEATPAAAPVEQARAEPAAAELSCCAWAPSR